MSTIDRYDYAFDPDGDDWAARLLRRVPPEAGSVLELGPGPGAMTRVLLLPCNCRACRAIPARAVSVTAAALPAVRMLTCASSACAVTSCVKQ